MNITKYESAINYCIFMLLVFIIYFPAIIITTIVYNYQHKNCELITVCKALGLVSRSRSKILEYKVFD